MARETSEIFAAPRSLPENFDVSLGENDRSTIGYCLENNSRRSLTLSLPDRKSAILVVKQQSMYRNVVNPKFSSWSLIPASIGRLPLL